ELRSNVTLKKGLNKHANCQRGPLTAFLCLRILPKPDAGQSLLRGLPRLFSRHRTVLAERETALSHATTASSGPLFENITLDARRHDAQAEVLRIIIEGNEGLCSRSESINRAFRDLGHISRPCRHRVATAKARRAGLRKHNMALSYVLSREKQAYGN